MNPIQQPWGPIEFTGNTYKHTISQYTHFTLDRNERGVSVSSVISGSEMPREEFILNNESDLFLMPALPPLPIVVRPELLISIVKNMEFQIYLGVPLMVQLRYGTQRSSEILWEASGVPLLKTWFGTAEEGEMAYAIDSQMHGNISNLQNPNNSIICPIVISNHSSEILAFEKMVLRVPYLTVYSGSNRLYAGTTRLTFTGQDQASKIHLPKTAPHVDEKISVMAHPREQLDSSVLRKSFSLIKTLYNG